MVGLSDTGEGAAISFSSTSRKGAAFWQTFRLFLPLLFRLQRQQYSATSRFDSRPGHSDFQLTHSSSNTVAPWSNEPLTEMSARNLPSGEGQPAPKADSLAFICLESVGASTSQNPMGLHRLLQGQFLYLFLHVFPVCLPPLSTRRCSVLYRDKGVSLSIRQRYLCLLC
jgi:hypothetical protein